MNTEKKLTSIETPGKRKREDDNKHTQPGRKKTLKKEDRLSQNQNIREMIRKLNEQAEDRQTEQIRPDKKTNKQIMIAHNDLKNNDNHDKEQNDKIVKNDDKPNDLNDKTHSHKTHKHTHTDPVKMNSSKNNDKKLLVTKFDKTIPKVTHTSDSNGGAKINSIKGFKLIKNWETDGDMNGIGRPTKLKGLQQKGTKITHTKGISNKKPLKPPTVKPSRVKI